MKSKTLLFSDWLFKNVDFSIIYVWSGQQIRRQLPLNRYIFLLSSQEEGARHVTHTGAAKGGSIRVSQAVEARGRCEQKTLSWFLRESQGRQGKQA